MTRPYVRSAVRAEVRRARRAGREVDREYLKDETGLSWNRLERLISQATLELNSVDGGTADGGANTTDPSPTNGHAVPFAPPIVKRKASR